MPDAIANRYEVLTALGEGGMGKVLSVHDTLNDREVALKLLRARGSGTLQQLKHEFWTMTRLRHPHTVEVYDFGALEDGTPYFTMEVVPGKGLDELLPMAPETVREVLVALCRALGYIHAQGYVHGDLKPENIRLGTTGVVKLMDFGLMERAGRAGGTLRGTLRYMAPEIARGGAVDRRADLYALGCVAYHLLAGEPPYPQTEPRALLKAHLEAPLPQAPGRDPALEALILRLMAKDPLRRCQSAAEVLQHLGHDAEEAAMPLLAGGFVGREAETTAFASRLEAGPGTALSLLGEAGSGKSRLAQELHLIAQLQDRETVLVRCREHAAPYESLVSAMRALLPLAKSACPAILDAQAPVLARLLPELGSEAAPEALEPQQEKMRLQAAVSEVLSAVARARGLVLVVDDAQWLDSPSLELIEHLERNAHDLPFWMVLVGHEAPWLEPMRLSNLDADEARALMASMLGTPSIEAGLFEPLMTLTHGNPRHLSDLLHHLVEAGLLVRAQGSWRLEAGFDLSALPKDLQGISAQKLDALAPEAIAIARAVALAGRADLALLGRIEGLCADDEQLYQALCELEAEGVLVLGPEGYAVAHHLLQSLIVGALGERERQALHGRIAQALLPALEAAPRDAGLLNAVADHLLSSDAPSRAIPYAAEAAERNLELFANAEARRYLQAGLAALEAATPDPALRLRYLSALGDVDRRLGDFQQASASFEAALALSQTQGDPVLKARLLTGLGKARQAMADYPRAIEALAESAELAEATGATREQVRALTTLGRIRYFGGDVEESIRTYTLALDASREAQLPLYLAESLAFLGYLFASDPERQEEGLGYLQESLLIKHAIGDKMGLNDTTMLLGNAYLALGRYAEANECFLQCQVLNEETGQRDEAIFGLLNLAIVAFEMGDLKEALRLSELARDGAIQTQSRFAEGMAVTLSGVSRLYLGQLGQGAGELDMGLALAREMNNRYLEVTIAAYRSDALIQLGRYDEALAYATSALAVAEEGGMRENIPPQQIVVGLAQLFTGEREAARLSLGQARSTAEETRARGTLAKAGWALALLSAQQRDYMGAQKLAHEALQDADEVGARHLSAQLHALLGELQLVQEHRSLASEHLRKAQHLAESIGSPLLHGRILRLMAEADPLRADDFKRMAKNGAMRLYDTLDGEARATFEAAWHAPWVPRGAGRQQAGQSLEEKLGKLGADMQDLIQSARDEAARHAELADSHRHLEQLIDFALKISQIHDLQLVQEMVMGLILEISGAERGFLLLLKHHEPTICQKRGIEPSNENADWLRCQAIADEVLNSEQPICLKGASAGEARTALCVPLKIRNAVVGAVYMDRPAEKGDFGDHDLDVVTSLASLSATAIENANLHEEWQDKSRKLEMLNHLSRTISTTLVTEEVLELVVKLTLEVTDAERGFFMLWEQDQLRCNTAFDRLGTALDPEEEAISRSICQKVLESGQSLCVADALSDEEFQVQESIMALSLRTVMCVPVIAKQSVLGLLYVDSQAIVNAFRAHDLEILEAIANHASVAIENAHLYSQLARRAQELEELVALYEEANLRASTDPLTGLHNRRFFQDQLNRDFAQARRHRRHLSVIMLDIDHFKSFNDTYGHALGDQVIQSVALVIGQAVRLADVVARYGGEEFIVALPDTDLEGAVIVAERIRRSVAEIELTDPEGNPLRQITVSLGVSAIRLDDERIAELIERADRGLYVAKVKGRNQIRTVDEEDR
ncbi:diguanylate cyclase [bacterium]|nr:diguanylate cyclase [bacterium]